MRRMGSGDFNIFQGITLLEMSISYNQFPDNTSLQRQIGSLHVHCTQTLIKPFKNENLSGILLLIDQPGERRPCL